MKIAFVGINYAPELTGIAVYTAGMAEYLAARGFAVTMYTGFNYYPLWSKNARDKKCWYRKEQINSVTVRRSYLYVPGRPTAAKRILHELSFVFSATINYLFGPRADCTIIVSPPLLLGIPIALVAKMKRSKTVFHVQDLQPDAAIDLGMLKKGRLTDVLYYIERLTYKMVDGVSTISQGMLNKIAGKKVDPDKLFILRNWANDDHIIPLDKSTSYRRDMGYEDKFIVLYSGNMGVKQGLVLLLEAASFLRDAHDIVFLIVGDGGEKQHLQRRAAELQLKNVTFLPVQPYARLAELLATADVAVIPQKKGVDDIVLPSKLANIMASRRPVIAAASVHSELGRIVLESKSGLVVEPEEPAQMAESIKRLYGLPGEREEMARNARLYMEKHFARRVILDEFIDRLQLILKK
jgi:colanic acid biosynthesis glycosyl transferase WcaI